jgi:hypothetical protein
MLKCLILKLWNGPFAGYNQAPFGDNAISGSSLGDRIGPKAQTAFLNGLQMDLHARFRWLKTASTLSAKKLQLGSISSHIDHNLCPTPGMDDVNTSL